MFLRAKATRDSRLIRLETWTGFVEALNKKCMILTPWCESVACEESVKDKSARSDSDEEVDEKAPSMGAKTLCIPFEQPENPVKVCFSCGKDAKVYALWGRSY